jgi:hypothetical protein
MGEGMKALTLFFAVLSFVFGFERQALCAVPSFKKVMIIVLENANYERALSQTYLSQLTKQGATFSNFVAETHPSQPNYIALVSGSTHGVWNDFTTNVDGRHVGDLLEAKGLSWKVYAEDYPGNCFLGSSQGDFYRKHVPFLSFVNIQKNPERCSRIVNASELSVDASTDNLPDFSLYIPNIDDDGHDTNISFADQWLARVFGPRISDPNFMKDLLLIVTFDEAEDYFARNQILTVFLGPSVTPGVVDSAETDHYSILRMIENTFGIGTLGLNDETASIIDGIWK